MKMNPGASQWAPKKPSPLDHMLQMADLTADAGTGKNVKSASGQTLKSATRKVYSLQISKSQICQIWDSLICDLHFTERQSFSKSVQSADLKGAGLRIWDSLVDGKLTLTYQEYIQKIGKFTQKSYFPPTLPMRSYRP